MKVWVYQGRHGELLVFAEENRHLARREQDEDNGCTAEQAGEESWIDGNKMSGDFSIDDGGSIKLMEVQ